MPHPIRFALCLTFLATLAAGCGNDSGKITCVGTSCVCAASSTCNISQTSCGSGSCSLACTDHNDCSGTCGQSCSISCSNGSTCTVTVGASGSISCASGATCHVTCNGSCSVSCSGATCDLKCPNDSAPKTIAQGGQCA